MSHCQAENYMFFYFLHWIVSVNKVTLFRDWSFREKCVALLLRVINIHFNFNVSPIVIAQWRKLFLTPEKLTTPKDCDELKMPICHGCSFVWFFFFCFFLLTSD